MASNFLALDEYMKPTRVHGRRVAIATAGTTAAGEVTASRGGTSRTGKIALHDYVDYDSGTTSYHTLPRF